MYVMLIGYMSLKVLNTIVSSTVTSHL